MSQDPRPWKWSQPKEEAAELVAEDRLTNEQIAEKCSCSVATLKRWKKIAEFAARVDELIAAYRRTAQRRAIAQVGRRVDALQDRWRRMQRVIEERAEDPSMQEIPGGETGILVRTVKGLGRGADFQVVEEYEVDTGGWRGAEPERGPMPMTPTRPILSHTQTLWLRDIMRDCDCIRIEREAMERHNDGESLICAAASLGRPAGQLGADLARCRDRLQGMRCDVDEVLQAAAEAFAAAMLHHGRGGGGGGEEERPMRQEAAQVLEAWSAWVWDAEWV